MAHKPRHEGGFSQGQLVIGGGSSSTFSPPQKPSSPQDYFGSMYTSPPPAQTGQSGGVAGSSLVPVTVDAGFGLDNNIVMVPVDKAPPSAGGTGGTGITGIGTGDFEDDSEASSGDHPYIPPKKPDKDKNIIDAVMGNTMVANLLKGVQSTDRFFKNLAEKGVDGLTTEDKIILANLIAANKKNPNVFGDLSKYTTDDVDVEELGERLQDAVRPLENTNYESLVNSYLSNKPTGIDSLTTMGSDLSNLFGDSRLLREDGSYTLEGLQKELGPQGLAYLKANDPKTYYSFTQPQTSGGLEELAQFDLSTLGGSPEDRQLAARVVAAREATSGQGGQGGGAGIPSIATAPTPFTDVNNNGILDNLEVAQATTTPVTATIPVTGVPSLTPTTIDYASMGPQYGGYVNQGISDPRFASYFQNLNLFPRRS